MQRSEVMKAFLLLSVLVLSGCVVKHDYDNKLYCFGGNAYLIEPRIGDLIYMKPTPVANPLCKETK